MPARYSDKHTPLTEGADPWLLSTRPARIPPRPSFLARLSRAYSRSSRLGTMPVSPARRCRGFRIANSTTSACAAATSPVSLRAAEAPRATPANGKAPRRNRRAGPFSLSRHGSGQERCDLRGNALRDRIGLHDDGADPLHAVSVAQALHALAVIHRPEMRNEQALEAERDEQGVDDAPPGHRPSPPDRAVSDQAVGAD